MGRRLVVALQKKQVDMRLLSRNKQNKDTILCDLKIDYIPNDALIDVDTVFHLTGFVKLYVRKKNFFTKRTDL